MRWFLDTEFAENGTTIKLISIALVSEDGGEYYRELSDGWTLDDCSEWVRVNVVSKLGHPSYRRSRAVVADEVLEILLRDGTPEIWAYFADYDWVVLCQLFGTMMDLPAGMPMFCLDIKQEMHRLGLSSEQLPEQLGNHIALDDARWNRRAWQAIQDRERIRNEAV